MMTQIQKRVNFEITVSFIVYSDILRAQFKYLLYIYIIVFEVDFIGTKINIPP